MSTLATIGIILAAIVILALLLMVYACMRMARESDDRAEREYADFMARRTCPTCAHHLGAEQCRINVEGECREGGGYELWEPQK
jgi:hypothetical protein